MCISYQQSTQRLYGDPSCVHLTFEAIKMSSPEQLVALGDRLGGSKPRGYRRSASSAHAGAGSRQPLLPARASNTDSRCAHRCGWAAAVPHLMVGEQSLKLRSVIVANWPTVMVGPTLLRSIGEYRHFPLRAGGQDSPVSLLESLFSINAMTLLSLMPEKCLVMVTR